MMKILEIWGVLVVISLLLFFAALLVPAKYTQTTDISDYGTYGGTNQDITVSTRISSFFRRR